MSFAAARLPFAASVEPVAASESASARSEANVENAKSKAASKIVSLICIPPGSAVWDFSNSGLSNSGLSTQDSALLVRQDRHFHAGVAQHRRFLGFLGQIAVVQLFVF